MQDRHLALTRRKIYRVARTPRTEVSGCAASNDDVAINDRGNGELYRGWHYRTAVCNHAAIPELADAAAVAGKVCWDCGIGVELRLRGCQVPGIGIPSVPIRVHRPNDASARARSVLGD